MGCSTSQSSQKNNNAPQRSESKRRGSSTAFREELDDDYLKSIESRLPPDTKVLILKLFSLSHMPYEHDKSGTYIEMETKPSDTVADNQYQVKIRPLIQNFTAYFQFYFGFCVHFRFREVPVKSEIPRTVG